MNPNPVFMLRLGILAKAFFDELAVQRLGQCPFFQFSAQQGLRYGHEGTVEPKREERTHAGFRLKFKDVVGASVG
jgi:hypothetical protein